MDVRTLTPQQSVGPQIGLEDVAALKAAGFTTLINNRPDEEIALSGGPSSEAVAAAAAEAGLAYHYVPIPGSGFGPEQVYAMRDVIEAAEGPVFAYCRSGTRSSNVWAICMAGSMPADEIIAAGRAGGYELSGMASLLEPRLD